MDLATIESRLYGRLTLPSAPDTTVVTRLRGYLNQTHRQILVKKNMYKYRRQVLQFTSITGNPFAVLPQAATKILTIQDRTNLRTLDEIDLLDIRRWDPGVILTNQFPYAYAIVSYASPVARQPSAASELFVKSDNAGDGATKTAFLEGVTSGGYYRTASVALNGVTAVSFGAAITDWAEVQKFYVALTAGGETTATGNITLNQGSGAGQELARIPIGRAYPRYTMIQLYPYPSVAQTYFTDVELHIEDMATATDEPLLPEDFHELLIIGALMREYERREKPVLYAQEKAAWRDMWGDLCVYTARTSGNANPNPGLSRWSQLGPYFPPGS